MRVLNVFLIFILLGAGFFLYSLEEDTRDVLEKIEQTKKNIAREKAFIRTLELEWSALSAPERIERLALEHFNVSPPSPDHILSVQELRRRIPASSPDQLPSGFQHQDPILEILRQTP